MIARTMVGEGLTPEIYRHFAARSMIENTSITVLKYIYDDYHKDATWRLWAFNDHAHLAE